jgi:hypothetical protein
MATTVSPWADRDQDGIIKNNNFNRLSSTCAPTTASSTARNWALKQV